VRRIGVIDPSKLFERKGVEAMAKSRWSDLNTPLIVTIGLIGAILLFGVAVPGLQALAFTLENRYWANQEGGQATVDRTDQLRIISTDTPRLIDGGPAVAIDVNRAMRLYVERHRQNKTQPPEADEEITARAEDNRESTTQ
jgi:hypothetical protein